MAKIRNKNCIKCGVGFSGHANALYCLDCREERTREIWREKTERKKAGENRVLGSINTCLNCSKEYVLAGGNQKYCLTCQPLIRRLKIKAAIALKKDTLEHKKEHAEWKKSWRKRQKEKAVHE